MGWWGRCLATQVLLFEGHGRLLSGTLGSLRQAVQGWGLLEVWVLKVNHWKFPHLEPKNWLT
jgi:hypothetical protein